jgi:large repetitive protein
MKPPSCFFSTSKCSLVLILSVLIFKLGLPKLYFRPETMNITTILRSAQAVINSRTISTTSVSNAVPSKKSTLTSFMLALSLLFSLLRVESGWGQVSNYTFSQTSGTYTDITGGTVLITASSNTYLNAGFPDDQVYNVTIPFTFNFNGTGYTSLNISTNGFITFGATAPATNNYTPLSGTATYNGAVAAWGGDLSGMFSVGGRTSTLRWETVGTAPNREVVIQYKNWRPAYSTSTLTAPYLDFQIRLKETTNAIDVIYGPSGLAVGSLNSSTTKQVGLRGNNNTFPTNVLNRTNSPTVSINSSTAGTANTSTQAFTSVDATPGRHTNGKIYRWTPPPPPTITSISPTSGCPGTTITITGTNFTGVTAANVTVGGTPVSSITSNSGTQIVAVVGSGNTGTVNISGVVGPTFTFSSPTVPGSPSTTNNTTSSFTANWTASTGATSYLLDVSTSNTFATFLTGFNGLNVGSVLTYNISGLTSGTTYYWRVRAMSSCASGNTAMQTVLTAYCTPSGTGANTSITNFVTTGGITNISNASLFSAGGYGNFTSQSCSQLAGQSVGFTLTYASDPGISIYIDWNNDLDFSDAGELVLTSNGYLLGPATGTLTIPAGQALGNYRMRVVLDWNAGIPGACPSNIDGEIEDYTFTVTCSPAQPSAISGSLSPDVGSSQTYSVTNVTGVSYAWSFPSGWVITGGQGTNSVTVTVGAANGTISVTPSIGACNGTARTTTTTIPNYRFAYISSTLGSSTWTGGESRTLSLTIKNTGLGTWNSGVTTNLGVRWDSDNSSAAFAPWTDYHSRVTTGVVASGAQVTLSIPIQAKNATAGPVYGSNLANGNYYLAFDLVNELSCWFAGPAGGVGACTVGNVPWYSVVQTISTVPTLSCTALTAFGNICTNATPINSFTISGVNLTNDVSIGSLAGYTYSTTSNGTYTSTLTLTPSSGTINQTVFVKFTPTAVQAYSGNIVVSSTGATSQNVAASGTGIAAPTVSAGSNVTICNGSNTTLNGSTNAFSITSSASNTFSSGNGSSLYNLSPSTTTLSSCPVLLSVNIPVGAVITGVNVSYNMIAAAGAYMSEQQTYLRCTNTGGISESTLSAGAGNAGGTMPYSRSNLTIANAVSTGGIINFELHAFRTWGGAGCDASYNYIQNGTLVITVNYTIPVVNSWSPSTGLSSSSSLTPVATPSITTTYSLTSTSANGCSSSASVNVAVQPVPNSTSVITSGTYCNSTTITAANGSSGTMYFQGTNATGTSTATPSVSQVITSSGTYYFRAYNGTCWGNAGSAAIVINTQPVITGQPSSTGETKCNLSETFTALTVTATGTNLSYQWYSNLTASNTGGTLISGATSSSYVPSNATVGTTYYYCIISSATCPSTTSTVSGAITVISSPAAPSVSPATLTVNVGASASITASLNPNNTGTTFRWWDAASAGNQVDPDVTTSGLDDATFNSYQAQVPPPIPNAQPLPNVAFCTPSTNYTYYVEEFDAVSGCPSTRTPFVISTNPLFSNTPSNLLICQTGGSVTLQANITPLATQSFQWQSRIDTTQSFVNITGATSSIYLVTPNLTTHYRLSTNLTPFGCSTPLTESTTIFRVGVLPASNFTPTANPSSVCIGETSSLAANLSSSGFVVSPITCNISSLPSSGVTTLCSGGSAVVAPTSTAGVYPLDDSGWGSIPIGFTYNFFGNNYTTTNVGTNGLIQFGAYNGANPGGLADFTFTNTLNNNTEPLNIIALAANDNNLSTGATSFIKYWTEGIAPTRVFVLYYNQVVQYSVGPGTTTGQIKLFETTGIVETHILSSTSTNTKVVGLQNADASVGSTALSTAGSITNQAWRFSPPANYSFLWKKGNQNIFPTNGVSSTSAGTASGIVQNTVGNPVNYTLFVTNPITSCVSTAILPITVNALPASPISSGNVTACNNLTSAVLSAIPPANCTIDWYTSTGTFISSGNTLTVNPSILSVGSNTYYAKSVSSFNCSSSGSGTAVLLTVVQAPVSPTTSATLSYCQGASAVPLTATGTALTWYQGTTVLTGAPTPVTSAATTLNYSVTQTQSGCPSNPAAIAVTIVGTPSLTNTSLAQSICNGDVSSAVTLISNSSGTPSFAWTASASSPSVTGFTSTGSIASIPGQTIANTSTSVQTVTYAVTPSNTVGSLSCPGPVSNYVISVNPTLTASVVVNASTVSVCSGGAITFTATPTNGGTSPTYQWFLNSTTTAVSGQTSSTYTLATPASGDQVFVKMTANPAPNCLNPSTSPATSNTITLNTAPATPVVNITQSTPTTTVCSGTSVTFSVATSTALGSNPTYQWLLNGTPISGATAATLTTTTLINNNVVSLIVTSSIAANCLTQTTATSAGISMTVTPLTTITTQPIGASVCQGATPVLSSTASGTGTLTYQWQSCTSASATTGTNLSSVSYPTALTTSLTTPAAGATPGYYRMVATGTCGSATSAIATISINTPTAITTPPAAQAICEGTTATFSTVAQGQGTISYQWLLSGASISGATNSSYSIPNLAASNAGQYSVAVTATCGTVTSSAVQLIVNPLTTISVQPIASTTICDSTLLNLSVTASGTAPISYQWYRGNTAITGATLAQYSDPTTVVAEAGQYTVQVTGGCSIDTSTASAVVVLPKTWITTQPVSYTGCALNPTSLSVTGLGANVQYQWSIGSNPSTAIPGATSSTYNLSNPQTSNSGSYTVTLTGANNGQCGTQTSNIALVTINPVPSAGTINGGNSGVCVGSTINLTNLASGGVWTSSNPAFGSISSTGVLTGVSAGTITVTYTVTNSFGCVSTATKVIQVKGIPTALIQSPLATSICQGETMNLQSSAAVSYAWSNGATTQNIAVNSSATGTVNYTVTVTGTNACTATSAPLAITVIPVPTIAAITGTGNYPNFCLGNTSNLTNATANGIWSSSNTNVLTVNPLSGAANTLTIGTATVSYYVANIPGCLNPNPGTATATITVSTPPAAFITPSGSTTFCQGGSVTLTAPSGVGYNYLWSNGATTQSINATTSGSYSLTVTATGGCSVTSLPTTVTVLPIPTATIYPTGAINICSGTNVTLSTGSAVSYVWSNGAITPTVSVNTSGTYSVTLTGTNGCTVTSAVSTVTVTPVPSAVITANGPTNICDGGSVGLSVPTAGSYLWSNGATTQGISATSTGNYSVTATNGICSTTSTPVYVNFNPVPSSTVTASGPTTFCQGGNVTLTAATGNSFTYLWSNGATTQSITVAASGTYSVTVSNSFNCSSTSTPISVVVNALPTASITAGGSTTICSGNTISLTAATANAYLWSTGATTQTISASTSGNYTVQAISAAGCTANSAATAITVLPSPTAVITQASGTTFCQGGSVVINSTPASAYLWSNNETTQAISATTTGVYSVLVTAANGCTATSNAINVNVLPTPTATIYPGTNVNICAGSTVTLSTGTAASYVWSNGAITPTITVSANGTHSVTLTGSNGCTATSALTTVTVNPIPVAAITAAGTTNICSGTSVNLTATSAGSYLWSNGATTQTIAASLAGAYTVTVTTAGCSATSASTTVNVNQSPTANVTASGPTSFCQGGSVSFTANAGNGYSYLWSNGATTATISASTSGNNSVTVTNLIGCSTTSAVNAVVVNPIPVATITAGGSTTICSGSPVSLSAPAGANYLWNTGSTAQSINAATAGNYTVVVTSAAGCSATSAPTTITVNALPSAAISSNGSTTFCQGGTVGLSANSGMTSYLWSNGDTGQSIAAANSGGYTVVVTDANGCSATSNLINVNVNPAPTATIFPGTNVTICSGSSVTLSTNSAVSYNWSTGAITPTIQVNTPGNYSVTLTGSNGCSATSPLTIVAVTTTPTAAITSSGPTTICQGDNVSLSAPAAANSYLWNTGATTQTITVSLVGSYFVTVGSNGCSATSPSTFVSYNPVPSAAVTASGPTTFCLGNSVSFSAPAGNGNSYLWNTGATTQSVSTSTPGTFSVTVTNGYGCSASSAINTVLVNPLPVVTPITGASSICESTQGQVSNVMTGGVYASSNLGVASIGQLNGQISGLTAGTTTISYLYTDNNGCSNTVTYPVTIIAAPVATITAGGPTTFCQGGSVTLTASSGTAYAWSNGATTASITVSASGSYSVSVTGANGCSASSQATTVNVLTPSPVSAINGANSVCVNSATSFTNATSGGTWSTSNPLIATVSSSGNVTGVSAGSATITYAINSTNGCQNAATKVVNVNAVPATALTASGATTFCQGSNVSLTASTGSTYLWSTGATTSSITASTSGTYNVTVTNANGCSSVSTNQLITVNANPTASISTNGSTNLCTGGSIVLMATPSLSYLWNTGATTSSITATTAGSYSVTVTNANGCSATSTATSVVVNASPSATVTASGPTTICSGSNVVLSATSVAGNTYQWSNNGVLISGATSASYTATTSGTYAVTVTNASGCSATSTTTPVSVVLATAATITPSGSTSLCSGSSVVLAANAGSSYLWSTGATTQSITVNTAANYSVTVTNALGCSATSTVLPVVVNAAPTATITAGGPTTFCQGGNVVLTASSGASYVWSNGATTASITASTPGSYSVLITNASGCAATAAATAVTVNAAPNAAITAGGSTTFCSGGSVTLTASAGASYLWSTGATTASISVNTAGARTVTVTNTAGCSSTSAATTIVVNATPTASITAGGSTTICSGSSVTLTASAGSSYAWSNGATTASIVANTTGNYTVTVFNANGCSAISTPTTVTVNNPSVANISTSGSTNFCQGGSVVLTATAASTYAWSTGATTQAITVSASGNYSVTLTNASGCTSTSPVTVVTSNALPTATITAGGATTFCQGGSVTLTASPATSYLWSNGATSASITASTAGSYTVQVANNAGCVSTSAATVVSVNALPTATITAGGPLNICAGSSVVLTASAGSTYLWSTGATTPSITVNTAGSRTVTVTNATGCSSTSAVTTVVVNALPTPTVSVIGSTTLCQGATVTLTTANGTGLTYQWKNNGTNIAGANGASYVANAAGIYTVQVTNAAGCSGTSTASTVVVNALPVASISNSGSNTICAGSSVNLTASTGTAYSWSNGATTASIAVNATGNYTVSITNAAGCTSSASTAITVVTPTAASITANGPASFCAGQNVTLTANPGASYVWSTGATTASITVSTTSNPTVQVTYANGCSSTSAIMPITVNALPAASITANGATSFCPGATVTLTASSGSSYAWTNGATTNSIVVSASGSYGVSVTNASGCVATAVPTAITVFAVPTASITTSGATTFCQGSTLNLTANAGASYVWSSGETTSSISTGVSGNYSVTVFNANGCSAVSSIVPVTVNVNPVASIQANGPTTVCQGSTVVLTSNGGTGFTWTNSETTASISVTTSGSYGVTVTNAAGCSTTVSPVAVTVNPVQVLDAITGANSVCVGATTTYANTTSGGTWSSDNTAVASVNSTSGIVSGVSSGTATIKYQFVNASGCTSEVTKVVTVNTIAPVSISASSATSFCQGGSVTLTAPAGLNYNWTNSQTTQSITVSTSGAYALAVSNAAGCFTTSSTVQVTVNPAPTVAISSASTTICQGTTLVLNAPSNAASYAWSNGATTQSVVIASAGTYSLTITDANGCSASTNTTIVNGINPQATVSAGGATTFCQGGTVVLNAGGGTSFLWNNGATTQNITVNSPGNYSVLVTNASGCSATSNSMLVNVLQAPISTITAYGPTTFCQGGSVTLATTGAASYAWSNSATSQSIVPTTSGTYSVVVTGANGCTATSNAINVTVNPIPTAVITPSGATTFCEGSSVNLVASGGVSYVWNNGSTATTLAATTGGVYTVTVTNAGGCTDTETLTVTVNEVPSAFIVTSGSTTFCQGGEVSLTAQAGNSYVWSNNATTQSIAVTTAGTYSVSILSPNGCSVTSNAITVDVNQPSSSNLIATAFDGYTLNGILYTQSGTYTQTLSNAAGCDSTITLELTLTVGIEEGTLTDVSLYPNPTSESFTVKTSIPVYGSYSVVDAQGKLVFEGEMTGTETHVNISSVARGIYYLRIPELSEPLRVVKN